MTWLVSHLEMYVIVEDLFTRMWNLSLMCFNFTLYFPIAHVYSLLLNIKFISEKKCRDPFYKVLLWYIWSNIRCPSTSVDLTQLCKLGSDIFFPPYRAAYFCRNRRTKQSLNESAPRRRSARAFPLNSARPALTENVTAFTATYRSFT